MGKLLSSPKLLLIGIVVLALIGAGLAGGALGAAFGGGFFGAPIAHIQLAAEPITASPQISDIPVLGDFRVTNTMVATWAAILLLVVVSWLATRRLSEVPGRLQGAMEAVMEVFLNACETVAGPERGRRFFPLVMTIFLFALVANWMGILPGFGTIGRFEPADEVIHHAEEKAEKEGEQADLDAVKLAVFEGDGALAVQPFGSVNDEITAAEYEHMEEGERPRAGLLVPFLRSANTDVNMTLGLALVAMVMVHYWGISVLGLFSHVGKYINFREGPIMLFVGLLEGLSEIARVISFTFRLFGNIFAGEVLLIVMAFLVPLVGIVPFLGLELFVGLVQAFIFAMLTLVFAATATIHHGDDGH